MMATNVIPMPTVYEYRFRLKSGRYVTVWAPDRTAATLVMKHDYDEPFRLASRAGRR